MDIDTENLSNEAHTCSLTFIPCRLPVTCMPVSFRCCSLGQAEGFSFFVHHWLPFVKCFKNKWLEILKKVFTFVLDLRVWLEHFFQSSTNCAVLNQWYLHDLDIHNSASQAQMETMPFFNYIRDFELILHERVQNSQWYVTKYLAKNSYLQG